MPILVPKLFTTLKTYDRAQLAADLTAGVVVGIVALPLAIAFAIASGVTPERGLYTAVIAGFLISALGGSRVQIGGPTGAFVVIVYGIVQRHGVDGLLVATLMAGVILIALGLARLGTAIKFIPFPVVTGFTAAIGGSVVHGAADVAIGARYRLDERWLVGLDIEWNPWFTSVPLSMKAGVARSPSPAQSGIMPGRSRP